MRYSLHDKVVAGLLALDDGTLRRVYAIIERVAAQPVESAHGMVFDEDGRLLHLHTAGGFRLLYFIARDRRVIFTEIRYASPPEL